MSAAVGSGLKGGGGVRKGGSRGCSGWAILNTRRVPVLEVGCLCAVDGKGAGERARGGRGGGRGGRSRTLHERSVQQGEHVLLHERGVHPGVPILEQLVDAVHERHARELVRLERILHRRVRRRTELLDHGREGRARISRRVRRARLAARSGARADATSDEEGGRRPPRWPRRQLFGADTSHHRSKGRSRARSVLPSVQVSVVWAAEISPRKEKRKISEKNSAPFSNDLSATTCPTPVTFFRGRGWRARLREPHSLSALARALGNARNSSAGAVSPGEERVLACASAPLLPGRRLFANRKSRVRITLAGARASVLRRDSHGRPHQRAREGARRQG